jgi:RNA polymerase sigma factor (TIGR02999 family)
MAASGGRFFSDPLIWEASAAPGWPYMSDVTQILQQIEEGDPSAVQELLPLVYEELRKLAAARMAVERSDHTLQATALVHEAYVRLVDSDRAQRWKSRGHFFAAAAEAMRRILLNRARDRRRLKRGGRVQRVELDRIELAADIPDEDLLLLDEAIDRLAAESPQCFDVVKLRFFAGLTLDETADALGISASTAKRHWAYARAWLYDALQSDGSKTSR